MLWLVRGRRDTLEHTLPGPLLTGIADRLTDALADRYTLEREIGRGGMATVYRAHDRKHDRPVALKVLRPEVSIALGGERFLREIALATRLQHPHILAVHDSGVVPATAGQPPVHWFTMPFVEGETLRDRLFRERQLPLPDALRIAYEAARALDHAHRHGIIHRDVKPENILLTSDGDTLVADFGVGRAFGVPEPEGRLTEGGVVVGTPAYMSPEQAAGERDLDGRTDVYSLGIVLYEMLAGEPPFTGPTAQAVVARRLTETPRPLTQVRDTVSPTLERLVHQTLARTPADRPVAREMAERLDALRRVEPGLRPRLAPRIAAATAALLLGAGAAWLILSRGRPSGRLDPTLVAVAPFDVFDPALELWHEGVVDLLSRNLDGAGPVRSVSPTVVVRRWEGRADPEAAGALGFRTGAGLAVYGSLLRSGPDSVRVRATLLEVSRRRSLGEWDLVDEADRVDRLLDSLTLRVLTGVGRIHPVGAVRLAGLGSTSLPALKAFLQGEQFLRRSEFDSALAHYREAIAIDSAFPLALRRAGSAIGWIRTGTDSLSTAYALRAGTHNHGLPPRDSLLVAAESLMASLLEAGVLAGSADSAWGARLRRLFATLEEATVRYPGDPETWFLLGEAENHLGPFAGRPEDAQLEHFDRAIALDSAFAPAYIHPTEWAMGRSLADAKRYLSAYLALDPRDSYASGLRLVGRLLDSVAEPGADLPDNALFAAVSALGRLPDSAELAVKVARVYGSRPRSLPGPDPVLNSRARLARILMSRGHLREGRRVLRGYGLPFGDDALFLGAVPAESVAAEFARRLEGPQIGPLAPALPWWAERQDTLLLRRASARADSFAGGRDEIGRARGRYLGAAAEGYLALSRGDTAEAISRLADLPRDDCPGCYLDRLVLARLYADRGQDREAWEILQAAPPPAHVTTFPSEVLWNLLRGRVAERMGDRDRAIRAYAWAAGMWRDPDPELIGYRDEARAALARLTEERP